jgi:hypothetical protein
MAVYLQFRGRDRNYNLGGSPQDFLERSDYLGFRGRSRSFDISKEAPTPTPAGGENEWIVWDYSPSDPLTTDYITTQLFR